MSKKPEHKSWIVTLRCEIEKEVITSECTKEEAAISPFDHAQDERELFQTDWHVKDVKPND